MQFIAEGPFNFANSWRLIIVRDRAYIEELKNEQDQYLYPALPAKT